MTKFEAGRHYYTRSICDHNCIFAYTVKRRTAKTAWIVDKHGKEIRRKIFEVDGVENIAVASYSFAPILTADRELEGEGTLQDRVDEMHRNAEKAEQRERVRIQMTRNFEAFMARVSA